MNAEPLVIVYKATNLVNGNFYIGFTSRGLKQREEKHRAMSRQGRGHHLHAAMRKYGADNFVFETIADFEGDEELAKLFECEAIQGWKPQYNISYGGDGHYVSLESRKKIGDANRGRPKSPETLQKMREARVGFKHSEESKRRISASHKGKTVSEVTRAKLRSRAISDETREKLAAANRGKTHSVETREKIRAIRTGAKSSDQARARISAANKGRPAHNKGTKHRAETIAKMRMAHLGRKATEEARANMRVAQAPRRKPVQCVNDGRVFDSSREAEVFYGLCQAAVTRVVTGAIKSTRGLVFIRYEKDEK